MTAGSLEAAVKAVPATIFRRMFLSAPLNRENPGYDSPGLNSARRVR